MCYLLSKAGVSCQSVLRRDTESLLNQDAQDKCQLNVEMYLHFNVIVLNVSHIACLVMNVKWQIFDKMWENCLQVACFRIAFRCPWMMDAWMDM